MTQNGRISVWRRVLDVTGEIGDALATPGGVAPDRATGRAAARREAS